MTSAPQNSTAAPPSHGVGTRHSHARHTIALLAFGLLLAGATSAARLAAPATSSATGAAGAAAPAAPVAPARSAATTAPTGPLPACTQGDDRAPSRAYDQWASTLLDTRFRLPRGYVPPGLVSTARAGANDGHLVRRLVIRDLRAMVSAAREDGVTLEVTSGYRSYDGQASLHRHYADLLGPADGLLRAARPGHSEHQLGTALDFAAAPGAHAWLGGNGWRYGFLVSYPAGQRDVSCYTDEPWHLRYYGRARAAEIAESGLVPRAWLWEHAVAEGG